ncbi:MAG: hypothetical protein QY327_08845 [Fimbriimonadaceae bacterium]|nr:MAG: hypothetical protein UZ18_ATM001001394 [Armatimonadetes bacterium OLB18]WKZ79444.1 MAG: hypothetical protein QY327_08845 [Fimbriimonadaceae bacterium]
MMELKKISTDSIKAALDLAERYRLLNEPEQAVSICRDVLIAEPGNERAMKALLLAMTDQFGQKRAPSLDEARELAASLMTDYDRAYYGGIVLERWGRAMLQDETKATLATNWLLSAMESYEKAEEYRPPGNDSTILRWNACARMLSQLPQRAASLEFGD